MGDASPSHLHLSPHSHTLVILRISIRSFHCAVAHRTLAYTVAMRAPLRIAVLECDTPLPNTNTRYNGYGGVFISLLKASAKALNQPDRLNPETGLEITKWDIVNGDQYPKLEDIDAVLLTGSSKWFCQSESASKSAILMQIHL